VSKNLIFWIMQPKMPESKHALCDIKSFLKNRMKAGSSITFSGQLFFKYP
jgi:hypothetical protein